jgi:hypothetical protein
MGCIKDLPFTMDKYLGTHSIISACNISIEATISRGLGSYEIIFAIGSDEYVFEINLTDPCIAVHKGKNFGFGLLLPCGEMLLDNDKIKVSITRYIAIIPLTCNYTLELK